MGKKGLGSPEKDPNVTRKIPARGDQPRSKDNT